MPNLGVRSSRQLVDEIFAEQPCLHRGETETTRTIAPEQSSLPAAVVRQLMERQPVCWGIAREVGHYLREVLDPSWRTLETGAGLTTLVFGMRGCHHVAVTPNAHEVTSIKKYARAKRIAMSTVRFVVAQSEDYLPRAKPLPLDFILVDGKHAFPWPVLDWFYSADRLRQGGLLMVDDCELPGVAVLRDFLDADAGWEPVVSFGPKTVVYRKLAGSLRDVAWHMQWLPKAGTGEEPKRA